MNASNKISNFIKRYLSYLATNVGIHAIELWTAWVFVVFHENIVYYACKVIVAWEPDLYCPLLCPECNESWADGTMFSTVLIMVFFCLSQIFAGAFGGFLMYFFYFRKNKAYKDYVLSVADEGVGFKKLARRFTKDMARKDFWIYGIFTVRIWIILVVLIVTANAFDLLLLQRFIVLCVFPVVVFFVEYYICLWYSYKLWNKERRLGIA